MNGHSDLYFKKFPLYLKNFNRVNGKPIVWCLGGNLSVKEDSETVIRKYRKMGFDIVSPKPINSEQILEILFRKFYQKSLKRKPLKNLANEKQLQISAVEHVNDDPLTQREFLSIRDEVLETWPTGKGIRSANLRKNHSSSIKNLHHLIVNRQSAYTGPLLQPRTGVAHTSDEIEIFLGVSSGGAITGVSNKIKERFPHAKVIAVDIFGSVIFGHPPHKRYIPGIGSSMVPEILKKAKIDDVVMIDEVSTY
jgi:hypothetical protein